ncbi:MAG: protein-ADP-ribose hydrolase [Eubacteriales bacterium]|nr:protein-ADP-ribose hydrolase [Eubacteriales bacterium]
MNQEERRQFLIQYLLEEEPQYKKIRIPSSSGEQKQLLRGLMNVRMPQEISEDFLRVQDDYLTETVKEKGVVELSELVPVQEGIYLWQGDITRLAADAIVNAANSGMTGCYQPNHNCIDNCIHTFGGVQMRLACAEIMERQGYEEPTGQAKITKAYNLPCQYVLHTVGPIIRGKVTKREEELLASCYRSCLELAAEYELSSVAFCCISTGVFCFPNERAAEIAVETVKKYRAETGNNMEVVFNVFKDMDKEIYEKLLR